MKVLALIYGDEAGWEQAPDDVRRSVMAEYEAFGESAGPKILDGAELSPTRTATTVRVRDGETIVSDGPFAETKEQLGGFYVLDVESLDEAEQLANRIPGASSGAVELRVAREEEAT